MRHGQRALPIAGFLLVIVVVVDGIAPGPRSVAERGQDQLDAAATLVAKGRYEAAVRRLDRGVRLLEQQDADAEAFDVLCHLHTERARILVDPVPEGLSLVRLRTTAESLESISDGCEFYLDPGSNRWLCEILSKYYIQLYDQEKQQEDMQRAVTYISRSVRYWQPE